ncbi:MAG: NAD(P)H-hydrate dehydratase [Candidatus Schekmanbacteria bacterium]|nr:NAD(P)H-hydrate dehydratase [Candidatus Schekmanbacteria bacterium]
MTMPVATGSQMREIDRITIDERGIPGITLMENAGQGVAHAVRKYLGPLHDKNIVVVCGKGNNGGDGMVVARLLSKECPSLQIFLLADEKELKGDALENYRRARTEEIRVAELKNSKDLIGKSLGNLEEADIIIDAIFGTGINGPVKGFYGEVIELINRTSAKVVSIDVPSGLSSDSGEVFEPAVHAFMTVTLGLPKVSSIVYPAASLYGHLEIADIGIPDEVVKGTSFNINLIEKEDVASLIPVRQRDAHKGDFGHLLIVGGSPGKSGAVIMAANAALRSGAGLVTVVVPQSLDMVMECGLLEAMSLSLPETEDGTLSPKGVKQFLQFAKNKSVIAIGPGIGTNNETLEFLSSILSSVDIPVVLDADAINLVAKNPEILKNTKAEIVITPHPGEMARLAGIQSSEVQARRLEICNEVASKYNVTVVLKGKNSIISKCGRFAYINPTGNPGMASGGSGDVLTGVIAGLISQKIEPGDAAYAGTYIHGLAGDMAASATGEISLIARDIIEYIPEAIKECLK